MEVSIFHYIFILNHAYLIFILLRDGVKHYWAYCLQLLIAIGLSCWALKYGLTNKWLLLGCGFLFIYLAIVPMLLTRAIMNNMQSGHLERVSQLAFWRYLITWAKIHRQELQFYRYLALLRNENKDAKEMLKLSNSLLKKLPRQFHGAIYGGIIQIYFREQNWQQVIRVFEHNMFLQQELPPATLVKVLQAYCEEGKLQMAASVLQELDAQENRRFFISQVKKARISLAAYSGDFNHLQNYRPDFSPILFSFWQAMALFYQGQTQAHELFREFLEKSSPEHHRSERKLAKHKLSQQPTNREPSVPPEVYQALEESEKKDHSSKQWEDPFTLEVEFPIVSHAIVIFNCVVFFFMEWVGSSQSALTLLNFGGNAFEFVQREGEYWRLITSTMLHGGYIHLVLNMFNLYLFGRLLETFYGRHGFWLIYFFSGLLGAWMSLLWNAGSLIPMSVGASGAICGLIGANTYFFIFRGNFAPSLRKHFTSSLLFIIGALVVMGLVINYIDNAAHFTGLLVGFVMAGALPTKQRQGRDLLFRFWEAISWVSIFLTCLALMSGWYNWKETPYPYRLPEMEKYTWQLPSSQLSYSLPFTWEKLGATEEREYYDRYNESDNEFIRENLTVKIHQTTLQSLDSWQSWLELLRAKLIAEKSAQIALNRKIIPWKQTIQRSPLEIVDSGNNRYWHFQLKYQATPSEGQICEDYYFLLIDSQHLGEFKFRFGENNRPKYSQAIREILGTVKNNKLAIDLKGSQ